jgi:hypothetical protein
MERIASGFVREGHGEKAAPKGVAWNDEPRGGLEVETRLLLAP